MFKSTRWHETLTLLLLALVYFLTGRFGLSLAFEDPSATPVWLGSGLALASILLLGFRVWPAIFVGAFFVNWVTAPFPVSLAIAAGNTLEGMLGALLVSRYCNDKHVFDRPQDMFRFVALAAVLSTMVSATIGAGSLSLAGRYGIEQFAHIWWTWWVGDITSDLIVAPLIIIWAAKPFPRRSRWWHIAEGIVLLAAIFAVGHVVFHGVIPGHPMFYPLSLLGVPLLIWATFRFGHHGAITAAAIMSGIAIQATIAGFGPFRPANLQPNETLLLLQSFMGLVTFSSLLLAAVLAQYRQTEEKLRNVNDLLEDRVHRRTLELADSKIRLERELDEHRRLSRELAESEEKYRTLVDLSPDAIVIECEGRIAFMNSTFIRLLGAASAGQLIGKSVLEFVHPQDRGVATERLKVVRESISGVPMIAQTFVRLDGTIVEVESGATPFVYRGKPAVQIVIHEVTKRRRLEQELRQAHKMQAVGQLAGGIAHDFNHMLASMLGYARLALESIPEGSEASDDIRQILAAGNRAKDLVDRILTFSRRSDNTQKKSPHDLGALVRESLGLMRSTLPSSIDVTLAIPAALPPATVDATQIHQVLLNLCMNAAHAMPHGGRLSLSVQELEVRDRHELEGADPGGGEPLSPGTYLALSVVDTGSGIEKKNLSRIFEPFFTTKSIGQGTGMGLAVVYGIVKSHGGTIRVSSQPGKGSHFTIYLPASTTIVKRSESGEFVRGGNESILLVEDEDSLAKMMRKTLHRLGYKVTMTTNPLEALELFRATPAEFDLILTDQDMPDLTGDHLAEECVRIRPDIPIILCTGYSDVLTGERMAQLPNCRLASKPFIDNRLEKQIRKILDQAKSRKAA